MQVFSFVYKRNRDRERHTSISTVANRLLSTELAIPLEQDRILAAAARSSAVVVAILSSLEKRKKKRWKMQNRGEDFIKRSEVVSWRVHNR